MAEKDLRKKSLNSEITPEPFVHFEMPKIHCTQILSNNNSKDMNLCKLMNHFIMLDNY